MAMFGKALGNGYAITSVIGKYSIMKKAEKSFISSTFWTERVGFVAALQTLKVMKKTKSWKKLINSGKYINNQWKDFPKNMIYQLQYLALSQSRSFHLKKITTFTKHSLPGIIKKHFSN